MGRFIIKYREQDGTVKIEGYDRMADVVKRIKKLTAYNYYFQVIHDVEDFL